ncbi:MAG: BamA/TamA family outer membrane protein [Bryobacteraceae bacterium]|nr:BamA/TamA family outer membrane protein [Bryobacteraceae bacterium]
MRRLLPLVLIAWGVGLAQVNSRVEEIEAARDKKAKELKPDEPSGFEQRLLWLKDEKILERLSAGVYGLRLKLGGMATGEGFALGPEYLRRDLLRGEMILRGASQASFSGAQKIDAQLGFPSFASRRLFADAYAVRHYYRRINYYGPGPDSEKTGRSNFTYEDFAADGLLGVHLGRYLTAGGTAGRLAVNVGPGNDNRFASAETLYPPAVTPGIDRQTSFGRWGAFAQFDYRDSPLGPRSGGSYLFEYDSYNDLQGDRYGFQQIEIELEQFVPFFNARRVIALRGKTILTYPREGQQVPFYLQPVLGGSNDLRGYRPYRFYDDNMLLMNAEYRWETFSGLDMAVFVDAGKVFHERSQLNFTNLESSVGFGFRFNVRNAVFLRLDVGFSHEGWMAWLKFNDVFVKRPTGRSSPESIF